MKLLRLGSGGRLVCDYGWDHEPADVTERAHQFLFEPIAVQSSFKVRDLLALVRACEPLQEIYARWFVREFLTDADLGAVEQTGSLYARVQFLRLETIWEKSDHGDFFDYDNSLKLSGYSMVQRKDHIFYLASKGERIRYSMEGSLRPYLDLPLLVDPEIKVFRQGSSAPNCIEPFPDVRREKATLGQIIEGFFYGISTLGPPEKSEDTMLEMHSLAEDPSAWHSSTPEEWSERLSKISSDRTRNMTVLLDHFISRYPVKDLWQLEEQIRAADDEIPIKVSLKQKFGRRVELLPEFAELDGKAFRNLYRLRRMQYEL
jgi:hypothetical protein